MTKSQSKLQQSEVVLIAVLCLLLLGLVAVLGWRLLLENESGRNEITTKTGAYQDDQFNQRAYEICKKRGKSEEECGMFAVWKD